MDAPNQRFRYARASCAFGRAQACGTSRCFLTDAQRYSRAAGSHPAPADNPGPAGLVRGLLAVDTDITVIYNDQNSPGRQSSDIMHELSHIILDHDPSQVILSVDGQIGMRSFDPKQEDEANWLGWTLLLPRPALMHCIQSGRSASQIAVDYNVSEQLVKYGSGVTGANRQFRNRG